MDKWVVSLLLTFLILQSLDVQTTLYAVNFLRHRVGEGNPVVLWFWSQQFSFGMIKSLVSFVGAFTILYVHIRKDWTKRILGILVGINSYLAYIVVTNFILIYTTIRGLQ